TASESVTSVASLPIIQSPKETFLAAHKTESHKQNASSLKPPISAKKSKVKRIKRINELSEGLPGDLPLAPPLQSTEDLTNAVIETPELPKIDVVRTQIIDFFLEPLNTFLDVDDFEEASIRFQNLTASLTLVMQEHFHLSSPSVTVKKDQLSSLSTLTMLKRYKDSIAGRDVDVLGI
ncbi:hypothetical protein NPIL_103881, partial [Nephila pilipes]